MARRRRGLNNEDPELVERRLWYATMEADYAARLDAEAMITVDTLATTRPMTSRERGDRKRSEKLERTFSGLMSQSNPTSANATTSGPQIGGLESLTRSEVSPPSSPDKTSDTGRDSSSPFTMRKFTSFSLNLAEESIERSKSYSEKGKSKPRDMLVAYVKPDDFNAHRWVMPLNMSARSYYRAVLRTEASESVTYLPVPQRKAQNPTANEIVLATLEQVNPETQFYSPSRGPRLNMLTNAQTTLDGGSSIASKVPMLLPPVSGNQTPVHTHNRSLLPGQDVPRIPNAVSNALTPGISAAASVSNNVQRPGANSQHRQGQRNKLMQQHHGPRPRMICFHGLGGSHMYFQQWAAPLEAEGIELWSICLPGRAFRVFEGAQDPPDGYVLPEPEEEEEEEYDDIDDGDFSRLLTRRDTSKSFRGSTPGSSRLGTADFTGTGGSASSRGGGLRRTDSAASFASTGSGGSQTSARSTGGAFGGAFGSSSSFGGAFGNRPVSPLLQTAASSQSRADSPTLELDTRGASARAGSSRLSSRAAGGGGGLGSRSGRKESRLVSFRMDSFPNMGTSRSGISETGTNASRTSAGTTASQKEVRPCDDLPNWRINVHNAAGCIGDALVELGLVKIAPGVASSSSSVSSGTVHKKAIEMMAHSATPVATKAAATAAATAAKTPPPPALQFGASTISSVKNTSSSLPPAAPTAAAATPSKGAALREDGSVLSKPSTHPNAAVDNNVLFFGHCLGGVLAFEVAQYLHKSYGVEIPDLFISSAKNPNELTSLNRDKFGDKMFKMSDRALWSRMGDMGGIPEDLIESRKDLMKLSVPGFRADCHMLEHYVMYDGLDPPAVTLSANITSIWAKQDKYVTHQDSLTGWTFVTKGKHTHISLSKGSHHDCLLVPDNQEALLGAAIQKLHEGQLQADDEASTCSLGMLSI